MISNIGDSAIVSFETAQEEKQKSSHFLNRGDLAVSWHTFKNFVISAFQKMVDDVKSRPLVKIFRVISIKEDLNYEE